MPDHMCQTRAVQHPREGGCDGVYLSLHPQTNHWVMLGWDQADSCLYLVQVPPTLCSGTATVTGGWAVKSPHPQKEHPLRAPGTASTSLAEARAGAIIASLALVRQPGTHCLPMVWALSGRLLLWGAVPSLVLAACSSTDSLLVQAACGCQWQPRKCILAGCPTPDGASANK